jgi:exodeoxyribonuclease VII large subunit
VIAPTKVQGEGASEGIVKGIQNLHEAGDIDLIIIGRGGGSLEDLWAFNEELVARAIYSSTIPIISAVGHETDFTIADFVADERVATPSAAAERAVPDIKELSRMIMINIQQIHGFLETKIKNYRTYLARLMDSPVFVRPTAGIEQFRQYLDGVIKNLSLNMTHYYQIKRSTLDGFTGKLSTLNPDSILGRGYSMTLKLPGNELISSVSNVTKKDKLKLILKDGNVTCEVEDKSEDKKVNDTND